MKKPVSLPAPWHAAEFHSFMNSSMRLATAELQNYNYEPVFNDILMDDEKKSKISEYSLTQHISIWGI
jgi:hypothetical protein